METSWVLPTSSSSSSSSSYGNERKTLSKAEQLMSQLSSLSLTENGGDMVR